MTRVLVIDDDEINNFTVDAILSRTDFIHEYEIKDGGWSALEYLQQTEDSGTYPTLIFVDINMPEMDGYEFLERYEHKFWSKHKDTRVYMLSSSISEADKEKALSYDCIYEYITKPLSRTKLSKIVSEE
ncbi:response regulator [Porifericola rhodea]|uniref:response regulator n=1 Tax=Porifericola rhodea TaxID=930972 RepID=UPI0026650A73|nr:response regulator [Porifericola rhodea]WKN32434.1 response regulator [Porifericola rhodea]